MSDVPTTHFFFFSLFFLRFRVILYTPRRHKKVFWKSFLCRRRVAFWSYTPFLNKNEIVKIQNQRFHFFAKNFFKKLFCRRHKNGYKMSPATIFGSPATKNKQKKGQCRTLDDKLNKSKTITTQNSIHHIFLSGELTKCRRGCIRPVAVSPRKKHFEIFFEKVFLSPRSVYDHP